MYKILRDLDRRWVFLLMLLAVAVPILLQSRFPETPSALSQAVFNEIDALEPGDRVLMAFDFDPASAGELGPMATAFTYHCAKKGLRMYYLALWPVGPQMIDATIQNVLKKDFPEMVYGEDYVNLAYKSGGEGVIKVILSDIRQLYSTDALGTPIDEIPMMQGVDNIRQMDLIVNVSAGAPGTKEWVQYAVTAYSDDLRIVAGCTGVQAPLLYPYIPEQLPGLLGAIKGAAEYEELVMRAYGHDGLPGIYSEARRRMGPQLIAHVLMILLIVAGNVVYFTERRREAR
jgi:hypothetical protein